MGSFAEIKSTAPPRSHSECCNMQTLSQVARLLREAKTVLYEDTKCAYCYLDQAEALLSQQDAYSHFKPSQPGELSLWQMRRVGEYISQNCDAPIRTSSLAALIGLSASHFSHLFRKTFGMTPHAYATRMRIEAACKTMLDTEEPLTHIAHAYGFCDQSHFSRTFRRVIGTNPQAWRQRYSHEELPLREIPRR